MSLAEEYADVLAALTEGNYVAGIANTGGGCESIEVVLAGERRILVNDAADLLAWKRADHRGWRITLYDEDEPIHSARSEEGSAGALISLLNDMTWRNRMA